MRRVVCMLLGIAMATGLALILLGFLAHETALIYGLPLLAAFAIVDFRSGSLTHRQVLRLAAAALIGVAVIIVLQMIWSAPPEVTARNMLDQAPALAGDAKHQLWRDIAIYMAVGGSRALATALCYNVQMSARYWPEFFGCIALLALYALILPVRRHLSLAALVMWVPPIFMMLVANDTGRWLKLGMLNGWLLASFLLLRGVADAQLGPRALKLGALLICGLLAMGPTRHNTINDAYSRLLDRLGYPEHTALDVWMDSCDPEWRRVVYGSSTGTSPVRAP